jgi:hypothetical protein
MTNVEIGFCGAAGPSVHLQGARGRIGLAIRFGLALLAGEQGIALELALHEGIELKVGQLQQLDRLLKLGRDDKALTLSEF